MHIGEYLQFGNIPYIVGSDGKFCGGMVKSFNSMLSPSIPLRDDVWKHCHCADCNPEWPLLLWLLHICIIVLHFVHLKISVYRLNFALACFAAGVVFQCSNNVNLSSKDVMHTYGMNNLQSTKGIVQVHSNFHINTPASTRGVLRKFGQCTLNYKAHAYIQNDIWIYL